MTGRVRVVVRGGAVVADLDGELHAWAGTPDPAHDVLMLLRAFGLRPLDPVDLTGPGAFTSPVTPVHARSPRAEQRRRAAARHRIPVGAMSPIRLPQ